MLGDNKTEVKERWKEMMMVEEERKEVITRQRGGNEKGDFIRNKRRQK